MNFPTHVRTLTAALVFTSLMACNPPPESEQTPDPDPNPNNGSPEPVESAFEFNVIDSDDNIVIGLSDGDVIDLASLPAFFNIEAVTAEEFGSVATLIESTNFRLERTEETAIWTMNNEPEGFSGGPGTYTFQATGYSGDAKEGVASDTSSISVTFTGSVTEEPETPVAFTFQIVDEDLQVLLPLANGDSVDLNSLPAFFHVEAVPNDAAYGSVSVEINGENYQSSHIENEPIWTVNNDRRGFEAGEGTYTLSATGHSEDNAAGTAGATAELQVTFEFGTSDPQDAINTAPITAEDQVETVANTAVTGVNVLANDIDRENDTLTLTGAQSFEGEVEVVADRINFVPSSGFTGQATVTYTVSDGEFTATGYLQVTVVAASAVAKLAWDKPTQREDGSAVSTSEIDGYEIWYRRVGQSGDYIKVNVAGGATETATIEGLAADLYEFKIAALGTDGSRSAQTEALSVDLSN